MPSATSTDAQDISAQYQDLELGLVERGYPP